MPNIMKPRTLPVYRLVAAGLAIATLSLESAAAPATTELQKFLVVATGDYSATDGGAFDLDNGELGANQEVVAESGTTGATQLRRFYDGGGIDLTGDLVEEDNKTPFNSNNRWTDADPDDDTVGVSDFLPGARPLEEAPDYSGNVAITSTSGGFTTGNADFFADLGIVCAPITRAPATMATIKRETRIRKTPGRRIRARVSTPWTSVPG